MYQYQPRGRGLALALAAWALAAAVDAAPLRVVATTSLIADVARQVGGPDADVTSLIPAGVDPHAFDLTPRDIARLQRADLIFANGLGLETFLERILATVPADRIVTVSAGGTPRHAEEHDHDDDHAHGSLDPHVWFDPTWVVRWADNIAAALAARDPANRAAYETRAAAYRSELEQLDAWIAEQIGAIPPERRIFATDHDEFGYLADRYSLTIVGALLPNVSTVSEVSARALADLQSRMRAHGARVIVVGYTAAPALAERVAQDIGARMIRIHTHALGPAGSESGTYLAFMRVNIRTLVDALRSDTP